MCWQNLSEQQKQVLKKISECAVKCFSEISESIPGATSVWESW